MSIISTIDCTLRDGGYTNNWDFDEGFQKNLIAALGNSGIEIVECGFINNISGSETGTQFKSIERLNNFLSTNGFNNLNLKFAAMMKLDEYQPNTLPQCNKAENCVSIIRVMVYKNEIEKALPIFKEILDKGYELHIQPTIISHYTDEELVEMLKHFNKINYKSISIVDTFGALGELQIKRTTMLFDKYVPPTAHISLHTHNNLSKAYQNAKAFISSVNSNRDVFIDTSVGGIGRGSGNLPTELWLSELKNISKLNYSVLPIVNFCDKYLKYFKRNVSPRNFYAYAITARYNMHPNYATYLLLNNYSRNMICKILELIEPQKYESFDYPYVKSLCEVYMLKV